MLKAFEIIMIIGCVLCTLGLFNNEDCTKYQIGLGACGVLFIVAEVARHTVLGG